MNRRWLEFVNNVGMVMIGIGAVHIDQGNMRGFAPMVLGLALVAIVWWLR